MTSLLALLLLAPPPEEIAAAAPPEIGAAILLNAASAPGLEPQKRVDLLEQAHAMAGRSQTRFPVASVTLVAPPDSLAGVALAASLKGMDALSLQMSAITQMIAADPRRALEMALRQPVPDFAASTCRDYVMPRAEPFYGMALWMASRGFPASEREKERPLAYLVSVVSSSTSPQLLLPATQLVDAFKGTRNELSALVAALAGAFRAAPADPLAFHGVPSLELQVQKLARTLVANELSPVALIDAYGFFLSKQLNGDLCETVPADWGLNFFNNSLRVGLQIEQDVPAIDVKSLKPKNSAARDSNFVFWETADAKEKLRALTALRSAPRGESRESQLRATLNAIESWQPHDGIPAKAFFHQKAIAYRTLMDLIEQDSDLKLVIHSFVQFLRDAPIRSEAPGEWFLYVERLSLPWAPAGRKSVDVAREEVRLSGDLVMAYLLDHGVGGLRVAIGY